MPSHEIPDRLRPAVLHENATEDDIPPEAEYLGTYDNLAECSEDHTLQNTSIWTITATNGTVHVYRLDTPPAEAYEADDAQNDRIHAAIGYAATAPDPDAYLAWKLLAQHNKNIDPSTINTSRPPHFHGEYPSIEAFALAIFHTTFNTWDEDLPDAIETYLTSPDISTHLRNTYYIVETPNAIFVFTNPTLTRRRWPGTHP